jgi:hypothetical protein
MKKSTFYYLSVPAVLISSFFIKLNNIFAQAQIKYGPSIPMQPEYGMQPLYGVVAPVDLIWRIVRWLIVLAIPVIIIILIILGIKKLIKNKSRRGLLAQEDTKKNISDV